MVVLEVVFHSGCGTLAEFNTHADLAAWIENDAVHPSGMYYVRDRERRSTLASEAKRGVREHVCTTGIYRWYTR